jgi:UDP-N-acetylmuramoylalanine-D-glutamate ligase
LVQHLTYLDEHFAIGSNINMVMGDAYLDSLKSFDVIVKSPGISLYNEKIYPHRKKILSQAQIFFDMYQ